MSTIAVASCLMVTCAQTEYSASIETTPMDHGSKTFYVLELVTTPGNVCTTLACRLVDLQNRANDIQSCVCGLMTHATLASAEGEAAEIRFRHIDLGQAVILAIGGSSVAHAGKCWTSSQAGFVTMLEGNLLLLRRWMARSHRVI